MEIMISNQNYYPIESGRIRSWPGPGRARNYNLTHLWVDDFKQNTTASRPGQERAVIWLCLFSSWSPLCRAAAQAISDVDPATAKERITVIGNTTLPDPVP